MLPDPRYGDKAGSVLWSDGHFFPAEDVAQEEGILPASVYCFQIGPGPSSLDADEWEMKHRWVRRVRRGGLQVRPKSWNKLSAYEVQNGTLFKWMDREKTFRHCLDQWENLTFLLPDQYRPEIFILRMCVSSEPKCGQGMLETFFSTLRKPILFYYSWDVIYWEKCLGSCVRS
jgi:hypothetical protein